VSGSSKAIGLWADRAKAQGKDLWLAEVQAQPWNGTSGFQPANLLASAVSYRQEPVQVVLLWGVETWLRDPRMDDRGQPRDDDPEDLARSRGLSS